MDTFAGALFRSANDVLEGTTPWIFDKRLLVFVVLEDLRIDGGALITGRTFRLVDPCRFEGRSGSSICT